MKKQIRKILHGTLGRRATRRLMSRLLHRPTTFFETELIHDYFDGRRQGTMVDVGAHFGESFVDYLANNWKIIAFEPDPSNRSKLAQACDIRSIRLRDEAISDREENNVSFFASEESSGISSLSAFRPTHQEVRKVTITTLRKALHEEGVAGVDFLKIDTEGHDLFVLRGFPWEEQQPEVVLCEFEDSKTLPLGYDHRQMGDFLLQRGYDVFLSEWFPIIRYGVEHQWRRWVKYPASLADSGGWGNFVAFRLGSDLSRIVPYLREHHADETVKTA